MLTPVIQKFHSSKSPWEVYQNLFASSEVSFFLDSHSFHPPHQTHSYLGADPFLEIVLQNGKLQMIQENKKEVFKSFELFAVLRKLLRQYRLPETQKSSFFLGGAVGYWGYELASLFEKIKFRKKPGPGMPELYVGFYQDLIVYDHQKKTYWLVTNLFSDKRTSKLQLQAKAKTRGDSLKNYFGTDFTPLLSSPHRSGGRMKVGGQAAFCLKKFRPELSKSQFENRIRRAKAYIAAGDIYQANLSQRFSFSFQGSPLSLYGALRQINPSPFASFLKIRDLHLVSSSPERLIQKKGRFCLTQPIAGTRPRRTAGKSEKALARELFHNEKERAEHLMLVDLERNDLGRVCEWPSVKVKSFMNIEKYSHVMHLVSDITGRIRKDKDALDLIQAMFPGGTITGCPKIRCMEIIDELEPVKRGIYTGSIGWLDFKGNLDLNIVIRTLILKKNRGYLQVGAGIVHDSDPSQEYEETLHKGEALVEALVEASR